VDLAKAPTAAAAAGGADGSGAAGNAAAAGGAAAAGSGGGVRSVSRLQAQLSLGLDGAWSICNTGRALLAVNGKQVRQRQWLRLRHLTDAWLSASTSAAEPQFVNRYVHC
jgi:hypothetical protein